MGNGALAWRARRTLAPGWAFSPFGICIAPVAAAGLCLVCGPHGEGGCKVLPVMAPWLLPGRRRKAVGDSRLSCEKVYSSTCSQATVSRTRRVCRTGESSGTQDSCPVPTDFLTGCLDYDESPPVHLAPSRVSCLLRPFGVESRRRRAANTSPPAWCCVHASLWYIISRTPPLMPVHRRGCL